MAQNLKWMETKYPILEEAIWEAAFFVCFYAQNGKISPISMRISHHRKKKKKKNKEKCAAHMWQKMFTLKERETTFVSF